MALRIPATERSAIVAVHGSYTIARVSLVAPGTLISARVWFEVSGCGRPPERFDTRAEAKLYVDAELARGPRREVRLGNTQYK